MLSVGFKTDKGMKREANEDSVFVLPDRQLYIVADGVGGRSLGKAQTFGQGNEILDLLVQHR